MQKRKKKRRYERKKTRSRKKGVYISPQESYPSPRTVSQGGDVLRGEREKESARSGKRISSIEENSKGISEEKSVKGNEKKNLPSGKGVGGKERPPGVWERIPLRRGEKKICWKKKRKKRRLMHRTGA